MGRSPWFRVYRLRLNALFRLAFASAAHRRWLTLPQTVTRRFIMQKARSHPYKIGLLLLVSSWFQVLFTPLEAVLFIIQSLYWFTIGRQVVLSLGGWAPQLHTKFHEHRATLVRLELLVFSHTGLSPSVVRLSRQFC